MTRNHLGLPVLAVGVLALAGGCGSGGSDGGGGQGSDTAGKAPKQVFAETCGGCHTLKAAGAKGQVGPNLDKLRPDAALVVKTIKAGPSVMPANLLQGAQAQAVADYVAANAGR